MSGRSWPWLLGGLGALLLIGGGTAARRTLEAVPDGLLLSEDAIRRLDPSIQERARELIRRAYAAGLPVIVASGYRSTAEQDALYAQGRTTAGPIVTDAKGGSSWHNFGLAFDLAILSGGKATFPNDTSIWTRLGQIAESIGLSWGGRAAKPDWDHFEYHPGLTLADARSGMRPA